MLVVIIFSGTKMKLEWVTGKDIFAEWEGDGDDYLSNVGPGKYFSMGPTCIIDGKEIQ